MFTFLYLLTAHLRMESAKLLASTVNQINAIYLLSMCLTQLSWAYLKLLALPEGSLKVSGKRGRQ